MADKPNLRNLLRVKYAQPSYVFGEEIPNGTSVDKTRCLDAIAMGCWKSVGIQIIGFEIKDSRADWLRELQDPSKAEAWKQYCHSWYLVAQKGVVKPEELPPSWGLMEPRGSGLGIRKACETQEPKQIPVQTLVALCRTLKYENRKETDVIDALKRERAEGFREGVAHSNRVNNTAEEMVAMLTSRYEEATKEARYFERVFGVSRHQLGKLEATDSGKKKLELFRTISQMEESSVGPMLKYLSELSRALEDFKAIFRSSE